LPSGARPVAFWLAGFGITGPRALQNVGSLSGGERCRAALARLAPAITTLARAEGLEAHARSVEVRTNAQ